MKRTNLILMILALIVLFGSIYSFSQTYFVVNKNKLNASIEVGNTTGINLENESLDFGRMVANTSVKKNIGIKNGYSNELLVNLTSKGNISKLIYHKDVVRISPNENREIGISAKIPKNPKKKNYSGTFITTMKKKPF